MANSSPNNVAKCTWVIENFSSVTTNITKKFSLLENGKIQFELRFYPINKNISTNYAFIEIDYDYDVFRSTENLSKCQYRLKILNSNENKSIVQDGEFQYTVESGRSHFQQISIYKSYISKLSNGFLQNDKLTIECEPENSRFSTQMKNMETHEVEKHDLKHVIRSLEALLESNKYSDVTFVVGGKDFKLHKNILTVNSPVFAAMFDSNLEESKQNRVEITDVDVEVFEELLRYIYSGKIPSIEQYAHELFVVSDKYQLESLKKICEQSLSSNLKSETVIATLILADMHSADHLKSKCLDFVRENAVEVKSHKDAWNQLKSRPELMMEVLDLLVDKLLSTK